MIRGALTARYATEETHRAVVLLLLFEIFRRRCRARLAELRRPRTRGECMADRAPRPCPWIDCAHHLAADVERDRSRVRWNNEAVRDAIQAGDHGAFVLALAAMPATCVLDVADDGPATQAEIARVLDTGQPRVVKLERRALAKLARRADARALFDAFATAARPLGDLATDEGVQDVAVRTMTSGRRHGQHDALLWLDLKSQAFAAGTVEQIPTQGDRST